MRVVWNARGISIVSLASSSTSFAIARIIDLADAVPALVPRRVMVAVTESSSAWSTSTLTFVSSLIWMTWAPALPRIRGSDLTETVKTTTLPFSFSYSMRSTSSFFAAAAPVFPPRIVISLGLPDLSSASSEFLRSLGKLIRTL